MIHNGIEYGLMQAYAEGFDLLRAYNEDLDLGEIAELWQHGSVVRSWLLELAARALTEDPGLDRLQPYVEDSGEGRWTAIEAVERGVPAGVITGSLFARFGSRDEVGDYAPSAPAVALGPSTWTDQPARLVQRCTIWVRTARKTSTRAWRLFSPETRTHGASSV